MNIPTNILLSWYKQSNYSMPWRSENNAYKIWISEIMLQQTRVQTVKEYYNKWMIKYPTINDVASSDIDDILKSQQITEGYYTVKAVKNIADDKKIEMPIMNAIYNI